MKRRDFLKGVGAGVAAVALASTLKGSSVDQPKLGKLPAQPHLVRLRLGDTVGDSDLLTPPDGPFGHADLVKDWRMLANDKYGDCFWAGSGHEHMLLSREGDGPAADFTDDAILQAYANQTGFDPATGANDNGTLVLPGLEYRRTTGLVDSAGKVHQIAGHTTIHSGRGGLDNLDELKQALYTFSVVGIGIEFPNFAMDQFTNGQPWDVQFRNSGIEGGHYIPLVGHDGTYWLCVTWGRVQRISDRFLRRYCDEAHAILALDFLKSGQTPEGARLPQLQKALQELA